MAQIRFVFLEFLRETRAIGDSLLIPVFIGVISLICQAAEPTGDTSLKPSLLILGDSLAAGYGLDTGDGFPALIQKQIDAEGLNFKVVNAGVSGDTTASGLRRLDWLLKRPAEVLLIELGGNDGLRGLPVESTRSNLTAIIRRARSRYPEIQIIVAGMQMPSNMGPDYTTKFQALFGEIAEKEKCHFLPFILEGVAGKPELNLPDMIHPTAKGHAILATNVWKVVGPILKGMEAARKSK